MREFCLHALFVSARMGWRGEVVKRFSYRGSYLSYVLTYFFFYFCMGAFSAVLSVYLIGLGKSTAEMAFIVSASSLFGLVMIPAVGYLNDRFRRPRELSAGLAVAVAGLSVLFALSRDTLVLFLLDGFIMGFISALMPVCERMAGTGRFRYGTVRIWGTFGYAAAAQLAGFVLEFAPQLLFFVVAVTAVVAALGFLGMSDVHYDAPPEKKSAGAQFSTIVSPMFLLFAVIAFLFSGASNLNMTYSPMLLGELGLPTGAVGTVLFVSTVVELPIILLSNRFMDRFSAKTLLILDFLVMLVQFVLYGIAESAALAVVSMVLLKAIASTLFVMLTLKIIRGLVPDAAVFTAMGLVNATNAFSSILMQNVCGVLVAAVGIRTLYLLLAGLCCAGMVLSLFLRVRNDVKSFS